MRGALRVRERRCPSCDATARGADARWCGTCGAALDPDGEAARADGGASSPRRLTPRPWARRTLAVVVGVAAVVALVVAGGAVADRATSERDAAVEDVTVAAPDPEVVARLDERPPAARPDRKEPTCSRGGTDDCFLWTVQVPPGDADPARHHVVGDLVLTSEGPELIARDLATGEERWRTDELGPLTPYQAEVADGVLVVAGEDRRAASIHAATAVAAGLDADSGEVRWREGALRVSLAAGGATVLTTGEGQLRAHGPDGTLRWEGDDRIESGTGAGAWAAGHVVSVHDGAGRTRLLRVNDGAPLDLEGTPVASDATATVLELHPSGGDGGPEEAADLGGSEGTGAADGSGMSGYALVDEDGEVWRAVGPQVPSCVIAVRLLPDVIELATCQDGRVDLLREDGAAVTVDDDPETIDGSSTPSFRVGAYDFLYRDRSPAAGYPEYLVVLDAASGREVALLSPETSPVGPWDGSEQAAADVVVLADPDRLVALPPAVRQWNGRGSGTSELRSLWPTTSLSVRPR